MYLSGAFTGDTVYFNNLVLNGRALPTSGPIATISDVSAAISTIDVSSQVWNLIGGAPSNLDSLKELADYVINLDLSNISLLQDLSHKADKSLVDTSINAIKITISDLSTNVYTKISDLSTNVYSKISSINSTISNLDISINTSILTSQTVIASGATGFIGSNMYLSDTLTGATGYFSTMIVKKLILDDEDGLGSSSNTVDISGMWSGNGHEYDLSNNATTAMDLSLTFIPLDKTIFPNAYRVNSYYFNTDINEINWESSFLINKTGDTFVAEDDCGSGIDTYSFNGTQLEFIYHVNGFYNSSGDPSHDYFPYYTGKFTLTKQ